MSILFSRNPITFSLSMCLKELVSISINAFINDIFGSLLSELFFFFFLQLTLTGTDLFHSYQQEFISYTNDIKINYNSYLDKRSFRISLIYNFGNNKISSRNKSTGNEDEKNRAR